MLDEQSWALFERLIAWLDQFKRCFGHRAQHVSLRQYVQGLLGDSPRKTMQGMLARVTEPTSYQAFQHFITHAPWDAGRVWRRVLAALPERAGVVVLDDTDFLKQGRHSVGVARQYSGTRRALANCQVAVTATLWTGVRAWLLGAALYLPTEWLTPARRAEARIPAARRFQEKWRLALTLLRRARAAGIQIRAVVADAGYGDVGAFRTALARLRLAYVMGVSSDVTVFRGTPHVVRTPRRRVGRPRKRLRLAATARPIAVATLVARLPARTWQRVTWRNGWNRPRRAEFVAVRVTPVVDWHRCVPLTEVWLLAERACGALTPDRYSFSNLPPHTRVAQLARLAHQRWAIEQQYREFKTNLGLDHFEGRSDAGWQHHVVLSAVAHAFLQTERMRPRGGRVLTFPQVHAIVQEIFTGLLFSARPRYLTWINRARERYLPLRI